MNIKRRLWNVLVSIDQLFYVLVTLGYGNPDETLSSAAYRTEKDGKLLGKFFRPIIDWLFSWKEENHCHDAFNRESDWGQK